MMFCFAKMMCAAAHEGRYDSRKTPRNAKASGVFSLHRCAVHIICAADIMAKAHHLRSNIIYFAWLGCGCGGILVNSAFSTSGVATLDTTISRMTAVK